MDQNIMGKVMLFKRVRKNTFRTQEFWVQKKDLLGTISTNRKAAACVALGMVCLGLWLYLRDAEVLFPSVVSGPVLFQDVTELSESDSILHEQAVTKTEKKLTDSTLTTTLTNPDQSRPVLDETESTPVITVEKGTIARGMTASGLLGKILTGGELHTLVQQCAPVFSLSRLRAGQPYSIATKDDALQQFIYEINEEEKLVVDFSPEKGFLARLEPIVYDMSTKVVHGTIDSSLYMAVAESDEKAVLAVRLADIFAWDVDFIRDIRKGDTFTAVVEKRYRNGVFAGYGRITAARFVNRGKPFSGYLFADKEGRESYFDQTGKSLRKTFLKAPLSFKRISSGYNLRRLHPILKIRRPHPGIDYAAPLGTPVRTVGDGRVIKKGYDKGGGYYLKVRHNSVYESTYMHLSRFARGMKQGKRVKQGQVIAYVGSTGLSTGPHLDFRMKRNGSYVNPYRIKSSPARPVPADKMEEFQKSIQPLLARLDSATMHASADAQRLHKKN